MFEKVYAVATTSKKGTKKMPATPAEALEVLEHALREAPKSKIMKNGKEEERGDEAPTWAPPRLRPATSDAKRANGMATPASRSSICPSIHTFLDSLPHATPV